MGETHWALWLLGVAGGGAIIKVIADWLKNILKGKTEKGIDVASLTSALTTAMSATLTIVESNYSSLIEAIKQENKRLEIRVSSLELRVEELMVDLDDYRSITSSTHSCALLKANPSFDCPVVVGAKAKADKLYKKMECDGEPI